MFNLKSGETFTGTLWKARGPFYIVKRAAMIEDGKPPTPMDGELLLDRDNIAFTQLLD